MTRGERGRERDVLCVWEHVFLSRGMFSACDCLQVFAEEMPLQLGFVFQESFPKCYMDPMRNPAVNHIFNCTTNPMIKYEIFCRSFVSIQRNISKYFSVKKVCMLIYYCYMLIIILL